MKGRTERGQGGAGRGAEGTSEAWVRWLAEAVRRPEVTRRLRQTLEQAAGAKRRIDHNMELLLSLLNLPSRKDHERLLRRMDVLQGSLLNVNIKLDRLLAAVERLDSPASRSADPRQAAPARSGRRRSSSAARSRRNPA